MPPPTNLQSSRAYAQEVYHRLTLSGALTEGCCDPDDLSSVADAVVEAFGTQEPAVSVLPITDFRNAPTNRGYLIAAALLREHVIKAVVTLNYDLAMSHALADVGPASEVAVLQQPADHGMLGAYNLVYLHRSANCDPKQWVLTTAALERDWATGWERVVMDSLVTAPVTVFAGLGSPAAVLTESVKKIRNRPGGDATAQFLVGKSPTPAGNEFFAGLDLPADSYVSSGWINFMTEVSETVVKHQGFQLRIACLAIAQERSIPCPDEQLNAVIAACEQLGLPELGRFRARIQLSRASYVPHDDMGELGHRAMSELILGIAMLRATCPGALRLFDDGSAELWEGDRCIERLFVAHGGGSRSVTAVQDELVSFEENRVRSGMPTRRMLIGGIRELPVPNALPSDLVGDAAPDDLVEGPDVWEFVTVDDLVGAKNVLWRTVA